MPIVVVTDSSPIRALHHLQLLSLCRDLYGSVIVPAAVRDELRRPTTTCPAIDIAAFPGFDVRMAGTSAATLGVPTDLDAGETEAILLSIELHADLLLIDERKATDAAWRLGLTTIGVFGILLEAKRRLLIKRIMPDVDRLATELNFFASPALRRRLAVLAGE